MGVGNSSIVAQGQLQDVADALAGLAYAGPANDFSGTDSIDIKVVDAGGLIAIRTIDVDVEVRSPPKIVRVGRLSSQPINLRVDEDSDLSIDALEVVVSNTTPHSTVQIEIFSSRGLISVPASKQGKRLLRTTEDTGAGVDIAGHVDDVNHALRSLTYRPEPDTWGSDEISIVVREGKSDGGWNTVAGIETIIVLIDPMNDAPTIDVPLGLTSESIPVVLAGEPFPLRGIVVRDVDAAEPAGSKLVSVGVSTGVEGNMVGLARGNSTTQGRIPGVRFIEGSAEGVYPRIAFSAPIDLANVALGLLQFWAPYGRPDGVDDVTITVADNGNWGDGKEEIVLANVTVEIQYQEDPLAVGEALVRWDTPPGAFTVDEDSRLDIFGLSLVADGADSSANTTWVDATVSADHGLVQVEDGGAKLNGKDTMEIIRHGPGSLTISGTVADVSAALVHWTYFPEQNYHGLETLHLSVQGHDGVWATNASVPVVVFSQPDAPTVNVVDLPLTKFSSARTVEVGARLSLYGVVLEDVDALHGDASSTLMLRTYSTIGNGTLAMVDTLPGLWVYEEQPSGFLVAKGTVKNLQSALDLGALEYVPAQGFDGIDLVNLSVFSDPAYGAFDYNESRSLSDDTKDINGATIALEITVVPALIPAAVDLQEGALFRTIEGSGVAIEGIKVHAPGRWNTSESVVTVAFGSDQGGMTLPGATGRAVYTEGQGEQLMKITGTEFQVNMALAGAVFTGLPFYNGVAALKVTKISPCVFRTTMDAGKVDSVFAKLRMSGLVVKTTEELHPSKDALLTTNTDSNHRSICP